MTPAYAVLLLFSLALAAVGAARLAVAACLRADLRRAERAKKVGGPLHAPPPHAPAPCLSRALGQPR